MKHTSKIVILLTMAGLVIIPAFGKNGQITCAGSTTVLPVAQATAEAFMDINPGINISVRGGGSGVGVAALQNKTADIANSSRPMKAKEITASKSKGINPTAYPVANDGISIVVHKNNPIKNLTIAQIKGIYTGKIKNWKELGGASMPIVVISRDVASGTFEVFNEKALAGAKVDGTAQLRRRGKIYKLYPIPCRAGNCKRTGFYNPKLSFRELSGESLEITPSSHLLWDKYEEL